MDHTVRASTENAYSNLYSFMGLDLSRDIDTLGGAVVVGVPFDLATSARAGARYGPSEIRRASAQLRWERQRYPWDFDLRESLPMLDFGDIDYRVGDSADMTEKVREVAHQISRAGNFVLALGGDHYGSYPLLQGIFRTHGQVALIHFDAHSDTEVTEHEYYHGSMFYRAIQDGLIDTRHSVQIGLRTEHNSADFDLTVFDAHEVHRCTPDEISQKILAVVGQRPVYLTIDIDVLDPSFAPGTGTPVAGGLSSHQLLTILQGLKGINLLAGDVMEVAPCYDCADQTTLAAATVALDILHLYAYTKGLHGQT